MIRLLAAALFLAACTPAAPARPNVPAPPSAASATIGSLRLSDAWVAATPGGVSVAAGYLTIANQSLDDDRLIAAASPRAQSVETHATATAGSMASMRATVIAIPAQSAAILAPGGLHLMFVGLDAAFEPGDSVPVILTFERAGAVELAFPVRGRGAQASSDDSHASHGH
jgi:periplasmic copper chaperone A